MVILALLPILFLIVALGFLKMAGWKACPIAAIIAFVVAVFCYNMSVPIAISAALEGVALACWPILLVIIMALFAYKLTVATGSLEVIKQMLTTVSEDKRVVFLLIAWVHRYPDDDHGCCHRFGCRRPGYESLDCILYS